MLINLFASYSIIAMTALVYYYITERGLNVDNIGLKVACFVLPAPACTAIFLLIKVWG